VYIFFSGGGPLRTGNPEKELLKPNVMLSWWNNVDDDNKPDNRFKALIEARLWQNKQGPEMHLFFSGYSHGKSLPEQALAKTNNGKGPDIMLTHHELYNKLGDTANRFRRLEEARHGKMPEGKDKDRPPERINLHFLDSGAHSLLNEHTLKKRVYGNQTEKMKEKIAKMSPQERSALRKDQAHLFRVSNKEEEFEYFYSEAFWNRVDEYAKFVKEHKIACDYYANLDVVFHPELTWKTQQYLEKKGLDPVPVVHYNQDHSISAKWLKHYLKLGYDLVALGGVASAHGGRADYGRWATKMFKIICNTKSRKPSVKVHGFAMTDYNMLTRFPWWSVDSASWVKTGGFGLIYFPHKRCGKFTFDVKPYNMPCSFHSAAYGTSRHITSLEKRKPQEWKILMEWLDHLGIPIGSVDKEGEMKKWGFLSHHGARKIANLRFFKLLEENQPEWPWAFTPAMTQNTFSELLND